MDQYYFLFILFTIAGSVLFVSLYFSKKARIKRKLKKAVLKRITDFRSGETAKIIGKVQPVDRMLTAPLSQRECSMYYVHVEQRISTGKSSKWHTIIEEEDSIRFVINDGSACAYVNSQHLKSYIVQDWKDTSGFLNDAPEELERYLNAHGYRSANPLGWNKTIRYREGILEENELVAVLGRGEWKDAHELKLPEDLERVLLINASNREFVYLSDDAATVQRKTEDRYHKNYRR